MIFSIEREKVQKDSPKFYLIGEIAERLGIAPSAIRFYEHQGLIKPQRHGHVRVYTPEHEQLLTQIVQLRNLGLPVKIICGVVRSSETGDNLLHSDKVKEALTAHLNLLNEQYVVISEQIAAVKSTLGKI